MAVIVTTETKQVVKRTDVRCFDIHIAAPLGKDKMIERLFESVNYEDNIMVSETVILPSVVHKCTDLIGVVDPNGTKFEQVMAWILWANDNCDSVEAQIAAIQAPILAAQAVAKAAEEAAAQMAASTTDSVIVSA